MARRQVTDPRDRLVCVCGLQSTLGAMASAQLFTLFIVAPLMALIGAWFVVQRYRASMRHLMKTPLSPAAGGSTVAAYSRHPAVDLSRITATAPLTLADNVRAYRQLLLAFLMLSLLMALTRTLTMQVIADGPISVKSVATLGTVYAWPVLPVLAVISRWSRWRVVGAVLSWLIFAVLLVSWRTDQIVTSEIVVWMVFDIVLPITVITALCLGSATRAVGPWLAPLFVLCTAASLLGFEFLATLVATDDPAIQWLARWFGSTSAIYFLFALSPWLIVWWPARALGRWLAKAYRQQQISELYYLFTAVWTIALIGPVLTMMGDLGWGALIGFLPLCWIPLAARFLQLRAELPAGGRPPTLLVLRVFQQDANVQDIFDRVIERWRLTGNTVLIAGTDLLERTIDADDIFTFIDGRLGERFIHSPPDVPRRLATFEWRPDIEGRYRVNECYCHDTSWQEALEELVRVSDIVLMDLRNFVAGNKGCLHELNVLSKAPGLRRVVVLINDQTDLPATHAAVAMAPHDRFVWLRQQGKAPLPTEAVLAPLFLGT